MDCYATWCGPCKEMEKTVYANDTVGNYINNHFISVKFQLDTSKKDDESIQKKYADAHFIANEYEITSFPTFLFLSPQGKLVHKGLGFLRVPSFLSLAIEATNPDKQYFTLLDKYNSGKRNYNDIPYMASKALEFKDFETYKKVSTDYASNYLPN